MSGATYRIDVFRTSLLPDPYPWKAHVRRVSDDEMVAAGVGVTWQEAEEMARELVQRMTFQGEPRTLYVDDFGQDAEAPDDHSVRV